MNPPSINFEQVKKWITFVIAVVAMLLGVLNAINDALPNQIGEPPIVVTNQGVTNLDDLTLSGALTADSVAASTVTASGAAALNGGAAITGSVTISGFTQYPFVFFGNDSSVNGTMIAHGRGATLTYPWCMVYDAAWVTATARISATNSTSVTLAIFGTDGEPWTTPPVPVRCGAVYVP